MINLNNQMFVVLEFATADNIFDHKKGKSLRFSNDNIIEVAAVKIEKGEISEHFSTFVAIEDCDPRDISFEDLNFNSKGLTAEHLIGAPSLKDVCYKVEDFCKGASIIVWERSEWDRNPLNVFKKSVEKYGCRFNNTIYSMADFCVATELKRKINEQKTSFDSLTALQISRLISCIGRPIDELLEENEIFIFSKFHEDDFVRKDSLGWALAYAQLFISLMEADEEEMEELEDLERKEIEEEISQSKRMKLEPVDCDDRPF